MSAVDRALLGVAVAISPAEHRTARQEQWAADVRDADELGMSATALAFGAFTTALFHRRAVHRSTWGNTMTAPALPVRTTPHTIRTVPVLVAIAAVSMLGSFVWLVLQPNYGYASAGDRWIGTVGFWTAAYLVPGAAIVLAAFAATGTTSRRRRLGASLIAAAAIGAPLYPFLTPDTDLPVQWIPFAVGLAGWLVVVRARRVWWVLLAVPLVTLGFAFSGVPFEVLPTRFASAVWSTPEWLTLAAGVVATRFGARPVSAGSSTAEGGPVETGPVALVDKSV